MAARGYSYRDRPASQQRRLSGIPEIGVRAVTLPPGMWEAAVRALVLAAFLAGIAPSIRALLMAGAAIPCAGMGPGLRRILAGAVRRAAVDR